jgi:predicted extracellular nuclease
MPRFVARLAIGLALLVVFAVTAGQALAAGNVVVSQVYGGGGNSGATYKNDFIELYNRSAAPVALDTWSVQYASAAGSSWQKTALSGTLAPGATYLVEEAAGTGGTTDLPTPNATGTIAMSATSGKVALVSSQTALSGACPTTGIVDLVGYGTAANCAEGTPTANLSNTNAAIRKGGGAQDTDQNAADFDIAPAAPHGSSGGGGGGGATPLKIDQIQSNTQFSPAVGEKVSTTGVVTATKSSGYFLEDPVWDSDPSTSEGIFVFTNSSPAVHAGDAVSVSGTVSEFIASSAPDDLPETELTSPTTTVQSSGNPLPAPIVIGQGGETPPGQSVPAGITFDESLEGMLVELDDLQAVGATNSFGETWVLPNFGAGASPLSARGGIVLTQDDQNPEKFLVDDDVFGVGGLSMPSVDVGAQSAGQHVGVMDYQFDNYAIHLLAQPAFTPTTNTREVTTVAQGADRLTVATFNVENLSPADGQAKFDGLADVLVNHLRSPDVVALEEVQDNDGPTDDGVVDSTQTLDELANAVVAAGGPRYAYAWVNPVNDADGGEPGGNIRVVFFYRTDVPGLSLAPGTAGGPTDANAVVGSGDDTSLQYNPGRVDPASSAWAASRKPLAGEFVFNGHKVFVIANHFVSKLGDDPMWGQHQPPVNSSETQRHQQANEVASFVGSILGADPGANVVVLGDLNDFQFSQTVSILEGAGLHDLVKDLPVTEQYTYVFDGNSQAIDHILVGGSLAGVARDYDVVHVNSEFAVQTSDHDPQVTSFALQAASVSANGPYTVPEGGSVALHATGSGTIKWDLDGDGVYETDGADATFSAAALDGPSTHTVHVESIAPDGATATDTAQVTVTNVAPTATFNTPSSATAGSSFSISLTNPADVPADKTAGFEYAFDCGGGFGAYGSASSQTCLADTPGTQTVSARIRDKDGGVSTYSAAVQVTVTAGGLCRLTVQYVESSAKYQKLPAIAKRVTDALAQAACDKLDRLPAAPAPRKTAVNAYIAAVNGLRSAGWLTAGQAATLTALAKSL